MMTSAQRQARPIRKVVLLVDDEVAILESLSLALRREPYNVLCAGSGQEAIPLLTTENVSVIVADEKMPGMSGSALLKHVKEHHPNIIRIMLTGHADVESAMSAIHEGWVYQYLHKPIKAADLASTIHNGLLLQSFMLGDEGPHMVMSSEDQEKLLEKVGGKAAPQTG